MGSRGKRKSEWEVYRGLKVRPPFFIRADGRGFGRLLRNGPRPYDPEFARMLAGSARALMEDSGLAPRLAFLFSDEVNLLFLDSPYQGRLEKLDSVVSGYLSAKLSLARGDVVCFDARAVPVCPGEVPEYLAQGQDEAWRNHVFSYGFYSLVDQGHSHTQAMEMMRGMKENQIHEMLFQRGTNLALLPAWQRRGVLIYRREGNLKEEWDPPLFRSAEGIALLKDIMEED